MNKIYENFFEEYINLFPTLNDYLDLSKYAHLKRFYENSISEEHIKLQKIFFNNYKNKVKETNNISIIFNYNIKNLLEEFKYNFHLIPLNHTNNPISEFIEMASGNGLYKFNNKNDYIFFIEKTYHFSIYLNQCINNMKIGIKQNIVLPKCLCKLLIYQIKSIIKNKAYIKKNVPKGFESYNNNVSQILEPILNNLLIFLSKEYLPKCRETLGISKLPNGKNMYKYLVRNYTTLKKIDILDIHNYGIEEVNRIYEEMHQIMNKVGFKGNIKEFNKKIHSDPDLKFKDAKELIKEHRKIQKIIFNTIYKEKFNIKISHNYDIKEVPEFNRKFAPEAYYIPCDIEKNRKGTFYINTNNIKNINKIELESLALHEGIPGHHLQLTYLLDNNFPMFLKTMSLTAYEEGWALYCELLGDYKNILSYYGKLDMEMMRAIRLVVDTGIHYYDWSYQKCLNYFKKYSFLSESIAKAELDRYIAIPGQALAYKIGERVFKELKKHTKESEKKFHDKLLKKGPLPLFLLTK